MANRTAVRLSNRIYEAVNILISNGEIRNPGLGRFVSISDVKLAADNGYATLYVSSLDEQTLLKSVDALNSASPFIQSRLAGILKTKKTPKLRFVPDQTEINALKVDEILKETGI